MSNPVNSDPGMKTFYSRLQPIPFVTALLLTLLVSQLDATAAATNTAPAARGEGFVQPPFIEPGTPRSTFHQPKKLTEGRNPFFPQSVRHIGVEATPKTNSIVAPIVDLTLMGISGTSEQPLAIINNQTFSIGEERDVVTRAGKSRIRCVEINKTEGTVLVQVGSQSRELRLAPLK